MTKDEIENYFVESAGYGRDKVRNFIDIVNKALEQKGERITELEKENAELRNNGFTVSAMTEQQLKVALEKGEQLEKENAELKEQCSILADCNTCVSDCKIENIEIKKQLTKAKELLKRCYDNYIYLQPLRGDIEQFLSEVEK